jgi:hypothetical protein
MIHRLTAVYNGLGGQFESISKDFNEDAELFVEFLIENKQTVLIINGEKVIRKGLKN